MIPSGYKTISWIAGILLAVTTSPEAQAFIAQYPVAAAWINGVGLFVLRWYTVKPVPLREKLLEKKAEKQGVPFTPPWKQKKRY